jgi:fumarylacetoacetate (FAA) hydrolase family protein
MHALPVLAASGLKVPFADTLQTEVQNAAAYARFQQAFDLMNVKVIDARFVEGGENQLGDIEAAMKKRPELFDYEKGGGMLFDLAVHPLNVLATLGFNSTGVDEAFLGKPKKDANGNFMAGVYERFGKEDGTKTGETYGRAFMRMGIEGGGQDIKTTIEAAKGAASNDGRLILNDGKYELRWEMFPNEKSGIGSKLEIKELATGEVIATSTLAADCYALIMQDISNFVKSGSKDAPYFPEHRDMIHAIAAIHTLARSQTISTGEEVRQLKIDELKEVAMNQDNTPRSVPVKNMSIDSTLPKDWKDGTFVGRIMLPEGPAIVRLETDGTLTDITQSFRTMSKLCKEEDPAASAKAVTGRTIGKLEDILKNTSEDPTSRNKPRLISPIDLQTVKAAGVTFAESLIERAVDEATGRIPNDPAGVVGPKQQKKDEIRQQLRSMLGEDISKINPGSQEALALLDHITKPVEEGGLGLSKHYFAVGLGELAEVFTKADTLASVGSGVAAGFLDDAKYGLNNPEPEVVLITSPTKDNKGGRVVGAALGNDINHRTIEGKSALLLGECKNQNGTCAIGPFIRLFDKSFSLDDVRKMEVNLHIENSGKQVFSGTNNMAEISREPQSLVDQMYAENKSYGSGAVLFCGTTCVPKTRDDGTDFTHRKGDVVSITSDKLGSLRNVMQHCTDIPQPEFDLDSLSENHAKRNLFTSKGSLQELMGSRRSESLPTYLL